MANFVDGSGEEPSQERQGSDPNSGAGFVHTLSASVSGERRRLGTGVIGPEFLVLAQAVEEAGVGGGKGILRQFGAGDPGQRGAADGLRLVAGPAAEKELEADGFLGIGMDHALKGRAHRDFDAQFLHQLAAQAVLERLVGMAFAAGEFPEPGQVRIGAPLCDQEPAIAEDQSRRDLDDRA